MNSSRLYSANHLAHPPYSGERSPWTGDSFCKPGSGQRFWVHSSRTQPTVRRNRRLRLRSSRPTRSSRSRASWCSTRTRESCSGCASPDEVARGGDRDGVRRRLPDRPGLSRATSIPAKVAQELPAFVKRVRSHGLRVTQIKGPAMQRRRPSRTPKRSSARRRRPAARTTRSAATPTTSAKPLAPQLDAIKLRLDKFVRLNQKHKITLVYDTAPGAASVGGVVLDLLPVMKAVRSEVHRLPLGHRATWRCTATACGKR